MVIPMAILHIPTHRGARYGRADPAAAQPPCEAAPADSGPAAVMSAPDSCGRLAAGPALATVTALAGAATASAAVRTVSRSPTHTAHPSKNTASSRARNEKRDPVADIPIPAAALLAATATGSARNM